MSRPNNARERQQRAQTLRQRMHDQAQRDLCQTLHRMEVAASLLSEALGRLRDSSEAVRSMAVWGPYETLGAAGQLLRETDALVTLLEEVRREARSAHASGWVLASSEVSQQMKRDDEARETEQ